MHQEQFRELIAPYHGRITFDIGTGDGLFPYNCARADASRFFIGIDANRRPLEKISEKIYRNPSRGGAANVLYLQSAVEALPAELDGIASDVFINFPWGSLLRAVAVNDALVLKNLRRVSQPGAVLSVILNLDVEKDRTEIERLGVPALDEDYLKYKLAACYYEAGFTTFQVELISAITVNNIATSWSKRLSGNPARKLIRITAKA